MTAAPSLYERLAAMSLELRGIRDVEPSGKTTKLEEPHSIELLSHTGYTSEYSATWQGKTLTVAFELNEDDRCGFVETCVDVQVHGATDVERDYLTHWFAEWYEREFDGDES